MEIKDRLIEIENDLHPANREPTITELRDAFAKLIDILVDVSDIGQRIREKTKTPHN